MPRAAFGAGIQFAITEELTPLTSSPTEKVFTGISFPTDQLYNESGIGHVADVSVGK